MTAGTLVATGIVGMLVGALLLGFAASLVLAGWKKSGGALLVFDLVLIFFVIKLVTDAGNAMSGGVS